MKLERMDDFFAARVDGNDEHMRTTILRTIFKDLMNRGDIENGYV